MLKSGIRSLDSALFEGEGIPPGSIVEIFGTPDSGKTALALWFIRTLQQSADSIVGWVCAETNISRRNMEWAGCDPDGIVVVRQTYSLCGLSAAALLIKEGCKLVVVDSIAALVDDDPDRPLKQVISENLYRVKCEAIENEAVCLVTNQERFRIPGRGTTRTGVCAALNRLTDCQIRLQAGQNIFRGGLIIGQRIYFNITKNGEDFSRWGRSGRFVIHYERGILDMRTKERV